LRWYTRTCYRANRFFKIIAESAVAAGVRRIEAITGIAAEVYIAQSKLLNDLKELLKNPKDLAKV
jgi:alanyl-tRNA synthetase